MRCNLNIRNNISRSDLFIVFIVIYLSLSWVPDSASPLVKLTLFSILTICIIFFYSKQLRKNHTALKVLLPFLFFLFIIIIYHGRYSDLNWIFKILLAYLVLLAIPFNSFLTGVLLISRSLFWPTIIGFILGIVGVTFKIPDILLSPDKSYYITPLLTVQRHAQEFRAYSMFWEPGVFSFFSVFVIFIRLFYFNSKLKDIRRELVYVLISQSVGGLFSLMLLLTIYLFRKISLFRYSLMFFGFSMYVFFIIYNNQIFSLLSSIINIVTVPMFDRNMLLDPSFAARGIDFFLPFVLSADSGLLGFNDISNFEYSATLIRGFSALIITNSWGSLSYFYGIPFMVMYLFYSYRFISKISYEYRHALIFWWVIALSASPVYTTIFIMYIIIASNNEKEYRL
jgi:hypothetical protein